MFPEDLLNPCVFEKKDRVPCAFPSFDLVRIPADGRVGGQDDSVLLFRQRGHPIRVGSTGREKLLEMGNGMPRVDKAGEGAGDAVRNVIVNEEPHACGAAIKPGQKCAIKAGQVWKLGNGGLREGANHVREGDGGGRSRRLSVGSE